MTRVLISGATGFLGRALTSHLNASGHTVFATQGDVTSAATWQAAPPCEALFHLAAKTFVPDSWAHSASFMHTNIIGTEQALSYCRSHKARMIFCSTYVYGVPEFLPVSEDHPARPNNPYTESKYLAEELCAFAARQQGVDATILRLFNVYGAGQRDDFLIPKIAKQIAANLPISVADLAPKRDYIYIKDVLRALELSLTAPAGLHRLNICAGQSHSVAEVIAALQTAAGTNLPVSETGERRAHEVMDIVGDNSRAREVLGWQPTWQLANALADMLAVAQVAA